MAVEIEIDDVTPRIAYTATGGQTEFAIPFTFFEDSDILVYVEDVLKTLTTHYTVAGEGDSALASRKVTLVTGATVGDSVVIRRDVPIARTANFPSTGAGLIDGINTEHAKIFAILQQEHDATTRTIRLADSDAETDLELPAVADRASKYFAFDADGNPIAVASVSSSAAVDAFWVTVLQTASAAAARLALGITDTTAYTGLSNWHHCR